MKRIAISVMTLAGAVSIAALAQRGGGGNSTEINNVPYDGRFTYARIKYSASGSGGGGFGRRGFDVMWNHDYPRSDRTFPSMLAELTSVQARFDASNVFTSDDPRLMSFPVVYLCEVGAWRPSEAEVVGLRTYMMKGGFVLVDDFAGQDWQNFEEQLLRVLPDARPVRLDASHPIFDAFYRIASLDFESNESGTPEFYGVFEDNDPTKRLMMAVNYNFDVSEYWEMASEGRAPIVATGEAFKLGINYVMYTLTH